MQQGLALNAASASSPLEACRRRFYFKSGQIRSRRSACWPRSTSWPRTMRAAPAIPSAKDDRCGATSPYPYPRPLLLSGNGVSANVGVDNGPQRHVCEFAAVGGAPAARSPAITRPRRRLRTLRDDISTDATTRQASMMPSDSPISSMIFLPLPTAVRQSLRLSGGPEINVPRGKTVEHDRDEALGTLLGERLLPKKAEQRPDVFGIDIVA